jgi:hypothetical protein
MVAHTYNPKDQEVETGGFEFKANLGYVVKNKARYTSNSPNDQEAEVKGLRSRQLGLQNSSLSQKKTTNQTNKKNRNKKTLRSILTSSFIYTFIWYWKLK